MPMVKTHDGDPEATGSITHIDGDGKRTELGDFKLEPSEPDGNIPQRVIDELVESRRIAKDYAQGYADALKAQAEKYKLKPGALKRYVNAVEGNTLEDLDAEADDLAKLLA